MCTPIVGSMTAWRIVDGAAVGTDEQVLHDAVRDYVENERDSYADVYGLLRVEYVGPRGIIDNPSDVVVAPNANEDASGTPVGLMASLAAIASLLVVVAAMYAARRRRASREGADRSVGRGGDGAPEEKAMPPLVDDDDRTMPAATTMSLSMSHSIDLLPPHALLLPPAYARSDDEASADVEGGGWDEDMLGRSVASAGSTKSELVPEEDAAPPSPPAEPPILARDDECPPTAAASPTAAAGGEAWRREASATDSIDRPSSSPGDWVPDSRGPSFEEDNDDDVAPMSPMAAGEDDRSRTRSTGSSSEGDISELVRLPSLDTRDDSLSFDDSVVPENDINRMRDIGSAELMVAGEAAHPVSAAWL